MRSLFFFSPIIWSLQRGFYNFIVAAIRLSHVVRRGRCNKRLVIHRKRVKNTPSISFSFLFDVQRYGFSISVYGLIPSFCSNWEAAKIWIWFTDTCCHFLQYLCSNRECIPKKGKNKKGWGEIAKAHVSCARAVNRTSGWIDSSWPRFFCCYSAYRTWSHHSTRTHLVCIRVCRLHPGTPPTRSGPLITRSARAKLPGTGLNILLLVVAGFALLQGGVLRVSRGITNRVVWHFSPERFVYLQIVWSGHFCRFENGS